MAAETTTVTRVPVEATGAAELVEILATRLATHDANLHGDIQAATSNDDPDTADLLNEISREVSQYLWFLEAHLQHGSGAPLPTTGSMSQSTNQSIGGQRGGRPPAQPQPQHSPQTQY